MLWANTAVAFVVMTVAVLVNNVQLYYASLFVVGFCLGVLYSVFVTLAIGLNPEHPSIASATIAVACGITDAAMPLIASSAVTSHGASAAYNIAILLLAVSLITGIIFKTMVKKNSEIIEKGESLT